MSRRHPFRRRLLRRRPPPHPAVPPPRRPLAPRARRALTRANNLMEGGQFTQAATIFGRLSEGAKRRGLLVRAANLSLQASRAHFAAGDVEAALVRAKNGLRLLVRSDRAGRASYVLSKMTAALREKGYNAQANQLEQETAQMLEAMGLSLDEARRQVPQVTEKRDSLPANCAGCGAPLLPDEVEWHDAHTAECIYCGAVIKTR